MRKIPLFLLLGCGLLTFEVKDSGKTTVSGAGVLGGLLDTLSLGTLDDLDLSISQEMADQGVEPGDLEEVVLTDLVLSSEQNLGFISHLDVYVKGDGIDPVLVATGDNFDGTEIALDTTEADLTDIVVAGGMAFTVDASGNAPEEDTDIAVDVVVSITATAQGACNYAERQD